MRNPSIDNGAAAPKTIERRKRKKAEYENVIRNSAQMAKSKDLGQEGAAFSVHFKENDRKQTKPTAQSFDSILQFVNREQNIAADKETVGFTEMVRELRSEFKADDLTSNCGIVLNTRMESSYPPGETVKLVVRLPGGFNEQKVAFTADGEKFHRLAI